MKMFELKEITGSLSKPSKMPGFAYGLPAKECKTGSKLRKVKGSTCEKCYAMKNCYAFKTTQAAQYKRLDAIKNPKWVMSMAAQIGNKKEKFFRWHDSGDVQNLKHLAKIFEVAKRTPDIQQAAGSWHNTSTVVTDTKSSTCLAPNQDNECKSCRKCWDKTIKNVAYLAH